MISVCFAVKGGSGTTVVVASMGLSGARPVLLVDLAGDLPSVLGAAEPDSPGVLDWLRSDSGPERLTALEREIVPGVSLLARGAPGGVPTARWDVLAQWLAGETRDVVVDAGTARPPVALAQAGRCVLVTRPCYLALRAAARSHVRPDAVVLVAEPGRSLGVDAVEVGRGRAGHQHGARRPGDRPRGRRRAARIAAAVWHASGIAGGGVSTIADLVERVCADAVHVRGDVHSVVVAAIDRHAPLLDGAARADLVARAVARLAGLDVLEQHLGDPQVDEVMVNADGGVWIDRDGRLSRAGDLPGGAVDVVLERVLAPTGRRVDRTTPIVDVRLPGGARLCAVVAPVSLGGTIVAIRRHRSEVLPLAAFAGRDDVRDLLVDVVASRCNVVVSGATSSGKTSLVAALLAAAPGDRLVVCEDTAELPIGDRHAVRLEARPEQADAPHAVELAHLVRAALRLRPDRLVVGEFRGVEVLAAIEAMNTGHDGSLSTCHANSALDALHRIETLLMQAAPTWPLPAIRSQVARSLDVIVHLERGGDGTRSIAEIAEVVVAAGGGDAPPAVRTLADRRGCIAALARRRTHTGDS